ncbi:MAG: response regulator, partial [Bdellovibrionaceae bacterium]|nr:response regulator [Pseudobdellovibrionaceae bacterium]
DDSKDNQDLLTLILTSKGYLVQCASNGQAALGLLRELRKPPDLILLDAQMPVMDGYQFRHEQKNNELFKHIPVLIMTGEDDIDISQKMLQPEGIMLKPLHMNVVINSVGAYF